jgi:hypothetical protein
MCGGRPDNRGIERPTVGRDAFHSGDQGPLDGRTALFAQLVSAYQDFEGPQYPQQHASLVHIIYVLGKDCRLAKLWGDDLEPVHHFIKDMMIVSLPSIAFSLLALISG